MNSMALNSILDSDFKKIVMNCHKDREVCFKCNVFQVRAENQEVYFKCKIHKILKNLK